MKLHRTTGLPDWVDTPRSEHNLFQRVAVASNGILTPGNIMTLLGFAIVVLGLYQIIQHSYFIGTVLLATGRLCDLADGWLAEATHTKSPLGELLDAAVDKISTILTIFVFFIVHIAAWWLLTALLVPHTLISIIVLILRFNNKKLHPSHAGKLSMAAAWISLLGLTLERTLPGVRILTEIVYLVVAVSIALGVYAAALYVDSKPSESK